MNNKKIGTDFEKETCDRLNRMGYWVHFISPDPATGKQPFDIIAVKDNEAIAIDCKTCASHIFRINRAEDNQIMAFGKWQKCGNEEAYFLVKHEGKAYMVPFGRLILDEKIDLLADDIEVMFECDS